jgi:flagellar biosynthesis protein FlgN
MAKTNWEIAQKLIEHTLSLTGQLYQLLTQEADVLKTSPEVELIDNITAQKKQLIAQLEELNAQFSLVLVSENLADNKAGISEYFQRAEAAGLPTHETVMLWQQIQLSCAECKALNEQNGASIDLLSLHAKRSLDILKGKTQGPNTYGRDGVSQSETISHSLAYYL